MDDLVNFKFVLYFVAWIGFMNSQYWLGTDLATWNEAKVSDSFVDIYALFLFVS